MLVLNVLIVLRDVQDVFLDSNVLNVSQITTCMLDLVRKLAQLEHLPILIPIVIHVFILARHVLILDNIVIAVSQGMSISIMNVKHHVILEHILHISNN